MRRLRAEQLALVPADGGAPVVLFAQTREPGELTTQDIFQVSPDGAYLAYAANGELHIRAADGSERTLGEYGRFGHMRFSPDGAQLAAIVGEPSSERGQRVAVFDLASGASREVGAFIVVRQLEWMGDSIVVQEWDHAHSHDVIAELPLAPGRPMTVQLDPGVDNIDRFVTSATGTRIVGFVREATQYRVVTLDAAAGGAPTTLGVVSDPITNAAASLDGKHVAFTTASALFGVTGNERPRVISDRGGIQSLWFARDGRLGYANERIATVLDPAGARQFDREGPISMLRFDPISHGALVATPAHAWDVAGPKAERVSEMSGRTLLGVDRFAGGLVLWTD